MSEAKAKIIASQLKPPTCPFCGKSITYLRYYAWELVSKRFILKDKGEVIEGEFAESESVDVDYNSIEYCCPFCGKMIAQDYESAIKFLLSG